MPDKIDHAIISQQAVNLINNLPSRISHITVFISVILIIILIMVATHVTRFIKGMRGGTHSSSDVTPSAIVIQPKKNLKDKMKKRKRTSLACKHRSNYNLPSKTMMIQIEAAAINPAVASVNLSAPPDYSALMRGLNKLPETATRITVPPLAKDASAVNSAANSAQASPAVSPIRTPKTNSKPYTIASDTVKTDSNVTKTTTTKTMTRRMPQ
ncbi:hypothetical protein Q1695_011123 [Nippostrongylus brasiliensis]|nr:hypothetical protein Q1695_011123 [Nippostrongylus brasiliensis]